MKQYKMFCDEMEEAIDTRRKITLSELQLLIQQLQNKYGVHALLSFDAGYSNISVEVVPTKAVKC